MAVNWLMLRFLSIFSAVLLLLFLAELTPPVQRALVVPWTTLLASGCAWLVRTADPAVLSYGKVLQDATSGKGISIEAGCNGVEACIMLFAAIVAYPSAWRDKLSGIFVGMVAVQALNVVRIISLFYLVQWNTRAFEFAHLYLWQALIMLDVLVVWLAWLRWVTRRQPRPPAGPAVATGLPS